MKDLKSIKENSCGGLDALYNGLPYTLTGAEVSAARSGAWGYVAKISKEDLSRKKANKEFDERIWRDKELARADIELNKLQDVEGVLAGQGWKTYRIQLRDWPTSANFPTKKHRPKYEGEV